MSTLLRRCRQRIAVERRSLGAFPRLPIRIGKAVTQEEVAEAVGISRQWYALLESGRSVRVSAGVISRIADALMMEPVERASLFRLALPELRSASLASSSTILLDAFGSLRAITRQLWAASTEQEALTVVREFTTTLLGTDTVQTCTRFEDGKWDRLTTGDAACAERYDTLIRTRWGATATDDLCCYTFMAQPGEVLTSFERDARFPVLATMERPVLRSVGLGDLSFAMANVRSQRGFIARIFAIHYSAHDYSAIECALLSTLADVTSLALSGCISSRS